MGLNSAMGPLLSAACKTSNRVGIEWYLRPHPTEAEMEAAFRPHEQRGSLLTHAGDEPHHWRCLCHGHSR